VVYIVVLLGTDKRFFWLVASLNGAPVDCTYQQYETHEHGRREINVKSGFDVQLIVCKRAICYIIIPSIRASVTPVDSWKYKHRLCCNAGSLGGLCRKV